MSTPVGIATGNSSNCLKRIEVSTFPIPLLSVQDWWEATSNCDSVVSIGAVRTYHERLLVVSSTNPFSASSLQHNPRGVTQNRIIVHIPFHEVIRERSFELPPRNVAFTIMVEPKNLDAAVLFFLNMHRMGTSTITNSSTILKTSCSSKPLQQYQYQYPQQRKHQQHGTWNLAAIIVDTMEARIELSIRLNLSLISQPVPRNDVYEAGEEVVVENEKEEEQHSSIQGPCIMYSHHCYLHHHRLWQPDPMVEHHLLPLLIGSTNQIMNQSRRHSSSSLTIWDLGSGTGRDVVFLAKGLQLNKMKMPRDSAGMTLNHKFRVVGMDIRYKARDAASFDAFLRRQQVQEVAKWRCVELNNADTFRALLVDEMPHVLYAVRFWRKAMVKTIVYHSKPFTVFAISHFCKPHHDTVWSFPHPKEKHVLKRNELQCMFEQSGMWDILLDDIVQDSDHGRPLIQFMARRRNKE